MILQNLLANANNFVNRVLDTSNHNECCGFLLDKGNLLGYASGMLGGIPVFSSDPVWRQILTDLGANVLSAPTVLSVNIDDLHLNTPLSVIDLKMQLLRLMDNANVFKVLFGKNIPMFSSLQRNIIIAIYKTGGVSGKDLRDILGFSPDITTHTVDTAISQIRKIAGRDFIQNKNGKYIIGNI